MEVSAKHSYCFIIKQETKEFELCPFSMLSKDKEFNEEWFYDFYFFKNQCKTKRETNVVVTELKKELDERMVIFIFIIFNL